MRTITKKEVTIKHTVGPGGKMKIELNGTKIGSGSGETKRSLPAEREHLLTWYILGPPGTKYSVSITKPTKAKFSHSDALDKAMQDVGHHWFYV